MGAGVIRRWAFPVAVCAALFLMTSVATFWLLEASQGPPAPNVVVVTQQVVPEDLCRDGAHC